MCSSRMFIHDLEPRLSQDERPPQQSNQLLGYQKTTSDQILSTPNTTKQSCINSLTFQDLRSLVMNEQFHVVCIDITPSANIAVLHERSSLVYKTPSTKHSMAGPGFNEHYFYTRPSTKPNIDLTNLKKRTFSTPPSPSSSLPSATGRPTFFNYCIALLLYCITGNTTLLRSLLIGR